MRVFIKYLTVLLFITTFYSSAKTGDTIKGDNIVLPDSTSLTKGKIMVILLESGDYKLFTYSETFLQEVKDQADKFNSAKKLYKAFNGRSYDETYYADSILSDSYQREMLKFIKASMINNGKCFLYNKSINKLEKQITLEFYRTEYILGRRYVLNGTVILDVVDGNQ
jgi:hypothetical protein